MMCGAFGCLPVADVHASVTPSKLKSAPSLPPFGWGQKTTDTLWLVVEGKQKRGRKEKRCRRKIKSSIHPQNGGVSQRSDREPI